MGSEYYAVSQLRSELWGGIEREGVRVLIQGWLRVEHYF